MFNFLIASFKERCNYCTQGGDSTNYYAYIYMRGSSNIIIRRFCSSCFPKQGLDINEFKEIYTGTYKYISKKEIDKEAFSSIIELLLLSMSQRELKGEQETTRGG